MPLRHAALVLCALAACGRDDGPAPAKPEDIAAACEAGAAARQKADEATCTCEVEAGAYPDIGACIAAVGAAYTPTCYCDLVAAEPDNADAATCQGDAADALADCVTPLACADAAARQACRFDYLQAIGGCPALARRTLADVTLQCLGEPAFACPSGEAIPAAWACDGQPDCMDMADESDCDFTCGSGETVPIGYQCDAEPDCMDGSDEDGCTFTCADGAAVPLAARCDGKHDCKDMSDETDCPAG